jgi:hypothetical protein
MIRNYNSTVKTAFSAICKLWRDIVFPPLCACCKESTQEKLFCSDCWALCAPIEALEKCPHCFEDSHGLCRKCLRKPELPFRRAYVFEDTEPSRILAKQPIDTIAAFMMKSFISLEWPLPDIVIPMPGAKAAALKFSEMIHKPIANLFSKGWKGDVEAIDTGLILLVIDLGHSLEECKLAISSLAEASPKRGYLLSLFPLPILKSGSHMDMRLERRGL